MNLTRSFEYQVESHEVIYSTGSQSWSIYDHDDNNYKYKFFVFTFM